MDKITTLEECKQVADDLAIHIVKKDQRQAELDAEILTLREKFADLDVLADKVKNETRQISTFLRSAKGKKAFPEDSKSLESALAEFGVRKSFSLSKLSSEWTVDTQVEALLSCGHDDCVRTEFKIDKERIEKLSAGDQAECGFRTVEKSNFWIEPKSAARRRISGDSVVVKSN